MPNEHDSQTNTLPVTETAQSAELEVESPSGEGGEGWKDKLVLVVDDVIDNTVLLSLQLQQQGYRVVTANGGEEAIKLARLTHPDVILMDIGLPGIDGIEATAKIRTDEFLRDVPVIALTAFSTDVFRHAAFNVGIEGYLTKPIDFDRLHRLICRVLKVE